MIRTPRWPASWKARIRWSGIARPTWMSGEVTSMPSFTRSGRPSASFCSSAPAGRTSTAFRVSSAIAIRVPSLEDVRHDALGAERVPDAERSARQAETRCQDVERPSRETCPERQAEAGREQGHRDGRADGEEPERGERQAAAVDRREQQHADARAAAGPVDEADRVRLNRPPRTRVCVGLEDAAAPANEEPRAEPRG